MDRRSSPGAALVATPAGLVRNVGPADSQWNVLSPGLGTSLGCGSASTPGGPTLLGVAGGTPCGIPTLPLLSPGATPMLGIGPGGLAAAGTCSKSLEQVVSVATDPLRSVGGAAAGQRWPGGRGCLARQSAEGRVAGGAQMQQQSGDAVLGEHSGHSA